MHIWIQAVAIVLGLAATYARFILNWIGTDTYSTIVFGVLAGSAIANWAVARQHRR